MVELLGGTPNEKWRTDSEVGNSVPELAHVFGRRSVRLAVTPALVCHDASSRYMRSELS